MDEQNWTKEPWEPMEGEGSLKGEYCIRPTVEPCSDSVAVSSRVNAKNDFVRIVACVNAMAGIADPAGFVGVAREMVAMYLANDTTAMKLKLRELMFITTAGDPKCQ